MDTALPNIRTQSAAYRPHDTPPQLVIVNEDLASYQTNFRVLVYGADLATGLGTEQAPRIKLHELVFSELEDPNSYGFKAGGRPNWKTREHAEEAVVYGGRAMEFLLQIPDDYTFPKLPEAPPQRLLPSGGQPSFRKQPSYVLFGGMRLLIFGNELGVAVLRG